MRFNALNASRGATFRSFFVVVLALSAIAAFGQTSARPSAPARGENASPKRVVGPVYDPNAPRDEPVPEEPIASEFEIDSVRTTSGDGKKPPRLGSTTPFDESVETIPPGYVGHDLGKLRDKLATFWTWKKRDKGAPPTEAKEQYETDAEYHARIQTEARELQKKTLFGLLKFNSRLATIAYPIDDKRSVARDPGRPRVNYEYDPETRRLSLWLEFYDVFQMESGALAFAVDVDSNRVYALSPLEKIDGLKNAKIVVEGASPEQARAVQGRVGAIVSYSLDLRTVETTEGKRKRVYPASTISGVYPPQTQKKDRARVVGSNAKNSDAKTPKQYSALFVKDVCVWFYDVDSRVPLAIFPLTEYVKNASAPLSAAFAASDVDGPRKPKDDPEIIPADSKRTWESVYDGASKMEENWENPRFHELLGAKLVLIPDDAKTLSEALLLAGKGGLVSIAPTGSVPVKFGSNLPSETVINDATILGATGDPKDVVVEFDSDKSLKLIGATANIKGVTFRARSQIDRKTAPLVLVDGSESAASVVFKRCAFEGAQVANGRGVIARGESAAVKFVKCDFREFADGALIADDNARVDASYCRFEENSPAALECKMDARAVVRYSLFERGELGARAHSSGIVVIEEDFFRDQRRAPWSLELGSRPDPDKEDSSRIRNNVVQ